MRANQIAYSFGTCQGLFSQKRAHYSSLVLKGTSDLFCAPCQYLRMVSGMVISSNQSQRRKLHSSHQTFALQRLSPVEVTDKLQKNEYTQEFSFEGSIKSYDSNQLSSNNPIEDSRSEARCLQTAGMLYGVFDGHGGAACAQVIAKRLFNYITVSLLPSDHLQLYHQGGNNEKLLEPYNDKMQFYDDLQQLYDESFSTFVAELVNDKKHKEEFQMKHALVRAFLKLDDDLSSEGKSTKNGEVNKRTLSVAMSGAVACVAHIDGPHLHVANVGDCQAVIGVLGEGNTWTAKKLTEEHNADNISELKRIVQEHPPSEKDTVISSDRLLGQLAPLRAMGDFRYKWSREDLLRYAVPTYGEKVIAPDYHTPPYLTACPDVTYHRLRPKDKFLIIASDGLWDLVSPLQAVRLVGEHMSGKVTLSPFRLPKANMTLHEINEALLQRKEALKLKPIDKNAATHLIRNALGGSEYGLSHGKLSQLLSLPQSIVRLFRDDITITVVYFDSDYLRHCPL
ncbi:[Pyruvate dehydrogenase [acetyl-transferring]]-phosphatase 1, mitochondrial [Frankliniella fusca]|uniref:[Pyruvate dehydrogenase [acetyl-transferring]]-phosphatase 1, mitochondrial n=1 Tax=Frankliniella fusca TaxID=407009 RepID=A0AAE1LCW1_9NEOP|nr:[Pyruvate dehydrogenase [acetyl-transferring]]-phosphatase 1, mitochondrial [Frankliniella fusca]